MATVDLPAKAKLLNFTQFNGKHGCSVCNQEGAVVRVRRGNARVLSPLSPIRIHGECYDKRALSTGEASTILLTP